MGKIKIYLAGGMGSNWQSMLIDSLGDDFIYFNPQDHNLEIGDEYTEWDLFFVNQADIIFAYMQKDNPSGIGLSLEVGYATALNKLIILIDEKSNSDPFFKEKFKIVRKSASIVYEDFNLGREYLRSYLRINKK